MLTWPREFFLAEPYSSLVSIQVGIYHYTHAEGNYMDVSRESGEGYRWIGGGSTHSKNLFPPPPSSLEEYHDRRMFGVSRALTCTYSKKKFKISKR